MQARGGWYDRGLAAPGESRDVQGRGAEIADASWGSVGRQGVLLIHGRNAHRRWWQFVARFMADNFRVAAVDLSGHSDSAWRSQYSKPLFADQARRVMAAAGLGSKPFVVAQSFGGFVGLDVHQRYGADIGSIIVAHFTAAPASRYTEWGLRKAAAGAAARRTRTYEDGDAALARFRLIPEQPCAHPGIVRYLAEHALRQVDPGFTE